MSPRRGASFSDPMIFEPLEARRFLAADLVATVDVGPQIISRFGETEIFRGSATVTNVGNATAFAFYNVRFVLSRDGTIGNADDVTIGNTTVAGTLAGESKTVFFPASLPSGTVSGAYHVGVLVDTGLEVSENSETNNSAVTDAAHVTVHSARGPLNLGGTSGADRIEITRGSSTIDVDFNGQTTSLIATEVTSLNVTLGGGRDYLSFLRAGLRGRVSGGGGSDTVFGGGAPDTISGGAGNDRLVGGGGRDRMGGNGGNDRLVGQSGADLLYGHAGNDVIDGGAGGDVVNGGGGIDNLLGGAGNDRLFAKDGAIDILVSGGGGRDSAFTDSNDPRSSIETLR